MMMKFHAHVPVWHTIEENFLWLLMSLIGTSCPWCASRNQQGLKLSVGFLLDVWKFPHWQNFLPLSAAKATWWSGVIMTTMVCVFNFYCMLYYGLLAFICSLHQRLWTTFYGMVCTQGSGSKTELKIIATFSLPRSISRIMLLSFKRTVYYVLHI